MTATGCSIHARWRSGCSSCQRASRLYDLRRRRAILAGTWHFNVPSTAVLDHLADLISSGMSLNAIARQSGVSARTLQDVRSRTYLQGATAAAVLAVRPCGPTARLGEVPAAGACRKVQALTAIGWSLPEQGRQVGMPTQQVWELAWHKQRFVLQATDRRIDEMFERLSATPGPSTRARNTARKNGWLPPLVWDDIDDPSAAPTLGESADDEVDEVAIERALAGRPVDQTDAELVAVLQAGVARGETLSKLAERVGINYFGARKMLGGELTPRRAKQAEIEAQLLRAPDQPDSMIGALLGVHHQTVTRARARLAKRAAA